MFVSAVKEHVPFGARIFRVLRYSSWDVCCRCMTFTHFVMIRARCVPRCMQWACMHKLRWNEITYNVCITNRLVGVLFLSVQSSIKRDQHPRWSRAGLYFVDSFSSYFSLTFTILVHFTERTVIEAKISDLRSSAAIYDLHKCACVRVRTELSVWHQFKLRGMVAKERTRMKREENGRWCDRWSYCLPSNMIMNMIINW